MKHLNKKIAVVAVRLALACALCVSCCTLIASTAWAGDLEDGLAASEKGDFATALKLWQPLAERGNAAAQFHLAMLYQLGFGVPQDKLEALRWYTKSATQGLADAQYNLATMYQDGDGIQQDNSAAIKWYIAAAKQGYSRAQFFLALLYEEIGDLSGDIQNYIKSYMWFNIASALKFPSADISRDKMALKLMPYQLQRAQLLATRCFNSNYKDCD